MVNQESQVNGEVLLRLENICKYFPGVVACDHINLDVRRGEIHTLLGENGAGKTTLMNCLYGLYRPDAGRVIWKDEEVHIHSAKDAIALGIGMVHQHFMLVTPLTVAENVVLGLSSGGSLLNLEKVEKEIVELGKAYGLALDPKAPIWQLPVGVQQRVEIIKALYRKADLLILDEPTAVLTPGEVNELFAMLSELTRKGLSIIFITHKLEEVMAVCDRVTVLRDGVEVGTVDKCDTNPHELARMMVGREVLLNIEKPPVDLGEVVLEVRQLEAHNDKGLLALKKISFEIHRGEILGIAGVDGNGQKELAEAITGLRTVSSGHVRVLGKDITNSAPKQMVDMNIAHIPEDRQQTGLILDFPISDNIILKNFDKFPLSHKGFLNEKEAQIYSERIIKDYDVRTPAVNLRTRLLSGGNQQKVILGRELSQEPDLIIAAQPTRGLDVGATEYVHARIISQRSRGAAVLFISTELEEVMSISDQIAVMYNGEIMDIVPAKNADIQKIGLLMAGVRSTQP